jgi:RimJ/RimL family protein N-acetyltransferase
MGVSSVIIKNIAATCLDRGVNSIRVDTHKENKSMQKLLKKNGFTYCGIIYLVDGNERAAFEKLL